MAFLKAMGSLIVKYIQDKNIKITTEEDNS